MANAFVEKLKAFGLHHGEKVAVALTGTTCVALLAVAAGKKPIDLTPDEVKSRGNQASQNLSRQQDDGEVQRKIKEEGIDFETGKVNDFLVQVKDQEGRKLAAKDYPLQMPFVVQEPGAGVIREDIPLLAMNNLRARPGRGGAWLFKVDETGKPVELTDEDREARAKQEEEERKKEERRAKAKAGSGGGMARAGGGMSSGMAGGSGMPGSGDYSAFIGGNTKKSERDRRKEEERQREQDQRKRETFAGDIAGAGKADALRKEREAQKKAEAMGGTAEAEVPEAPRSTANYIEELQGKRWVVITGLLDNQALRERYARALKLDVNAAYPYYKDLGVQRQRKLDNGEWSDWEDVSNDENRKITDNLPEQQKDFSPDDVRLSTLVAPLPFLRVGSWVGSEPIEVIPKEVLETPKRDYSSMAYGGMMMPGMGMGSMGMGMEGDYGMGMPGGGMMGGSAMMGSGFDMMMMGGGFAVNDESFPQNLPKTDAELIMARYVDFTVERETTYRYRLRLVTYNPNYKRDNVAPGTDTASKEINGPWTDPTGEVTVPADVAIFAMGNMPYTGNPMDRPDQVQFQVAAFNPTDGVTVIENFAAGPGEIVGAMKQARVPDYSEDFVKPKGKQIDFFSAKLVVDTIGGTKPLPRLELPGSDRAEIPPVALLLRPDGRIVVRAAAEDRVDESRIEMKESFARAIEDATAGNKSKTNSGFEGMMPGMMGSGGRR